MDSWLDFLRQADLGAAFSRPFGEFFEIAGGHEYFAFLLVCASVVVLIRWRRRPVFSLVPAVLACVFALMGSHRVWQQVKLEVSRLGAATTVADYQKGANIAVVWPGITIAFLLLLALCVGFLALQAKRKA